LYHFFGSDAVNVDRDTLRRGDRGSGANPRRPARADEQPQQPATVQIQRGYAFAVASHPCVLLVRSDDFVGWRADTLPRSPTDELRKVIRQIFARG
jgi:hypothetical protein